jgi:aminoglycoside phosphotransferase (APT) family kinase protein
MASLMRRLPHGYSNDTTGDGTVVVKRYRGPDAVVRRELERNVLERLQGLVPVPPVLARPGDAPLGQVTLGFVHGAHGQDLLEAGRADEVLQASGRVLARIHRLVVAEVLPGSRARAGTVLVHGDFGPNNLLFDPATSDVVAVLDWEWAHIGRRVEDLAWCEWIVRMHHPRQVGALDSFFTAYGARPEWVERQAAMLARCQELIEVCQSRDPGGDGVRLWQARATVTAGWAE